MIASEQKIYFINRKEDLNAFLPKLEMRRRIAVDLEADSMFHFKERVCLVQIATKEMTLVIDTVRIDDLTCLKPLFINPSIEKIFHGSDYDVRSLYRDFQIPIHNLFDTELASRFLGMKETGLGAVLSNHFSVTLDKKFQKKDWSQRPLPQDMIEYGARDVIYLLPLAKLLQQALKNMGRLSWVLEECEHQSRVRPPVVDDSEPLFLKVRGAGRLDRKSLGILEALLKYRLEKASQMNRPPFKVLNNRLLLELAVKRPGTMEMLTQDKLLSPRQISMYGKGIVHGIRHGLGISKDDLPVYPQKRPPRLKPNVTKRIEKIKTWRDQVADRLCLDGSLILNKALITDIAVKYPKTMSDLDKIGGLKNWQKKEFGAEIIHALSPSFIT